MNEWQELGFGKMPKSWEISTLGAISTLLTDGSHFSPKPEKSGYFMASVKDMEYGRFNFRECKTISVEDFSNLEKNNCKPLPGDILISKDGANCLDLIFVYNQKEQIVLLSSIAIVRLKSGFDSQFYRYYLLSPNVQEMMKNNFVSGSAIPRVVLKDFRNVPVPILPLPEQRAIAEVLSSLDDKIDLLHRQNKTLEQLAEAMFRQWFVEEAEEGWLTATIDEVAAVNSKTLTREFPYDEIEYLDTGSITNGRIESFQTMPLADAPSRAQRLVAENDIVYSLVRPGQRHFGMIHDPKPNTVVSTGFCVITCESISPYFLYTLLTRQETVDYFDMVAEASTSAYPSLRPSDIGSFQFQFPSKELLDKFHNNSSNFWSKIKSNTHQIHTLTQLRDSLLPKLMSGEVRVG
jgi:type I restriction enzyme S subunit